MISPRHDQLPSEALEELFSSLSSWIASSGLVLLMLNASVAQFAVGERIGAAIGSLESIRRQLDTLITAARKRDYLDVSGSARGAQIQ